MSGHHRPQNDPCEGRESVTDAVIIDLQERREMGVKKYGTELKTFNGRNALVDALQEAMDLTLYLKQALLERDELVSMLKAEHFDRIENDGQLHYLRTCPVCQIIKKYEVQNE